MVVQDILDFIQQVKEFRSIPDFDVTYLDELTKHFMLHAKSDVLSEQDLELIRTVFNKRWIKIVDGEYDYIRNPEGINKLWIQLAHNLAIHSNNSFIYYLFPNVENTVDYNNLTALIETVHPENFYLGNGGDTLYRKRGLCEFLIKESKFTLSTCRKAIKFQAITVDELMRLKWNHEKQAEFSIGDEQFYNFWDFLQKKVFTQLQAKGEMPLGLLTSLYELVVLYYELKTSNQNFDVFKQQFTNFLNELYQLDLHQINFLYGLKLNINQRDCYLFETFIDIYTASTYTLDEQMKAIGDKLYHYNSVFVKPKEMQSSPQIPKMEVILPGLVNSRESESTPSLSIEEQVTHVKLLLIALLTGDFELSPFSTSTIHFWDISTKIFSNGEHIYKILIPHLLSNDSKRLLSEYSAIVKDKIIKPQKPLGLFDWFTEYKSTKDWYKQVELGEFYKQNVYWHDPALLLLALAKYSGWDQGLKIKIDLFLDKLIHTYAQNGKEHLLQFRVNVLFTQLLNDCSPTQRKAILMLVQLHSQTNYKTGFLNNCILHILHRLDPQAVNKHTPSSIHSFFSIFSWPEPDVLVVSRAKNKVLGAIDALKSIVHSHEAVLGPRNYRRMIDYLSLISRPILTAEEMDEAKQAGKSLDFLGAPT